MQDKLCTINYDYCIGFEKIGEEHAQFSFLISMTVSIDAACCDGKLSAGCESQFKTDNATKLQRWRGHCTGQPGSASSFSRTVETATDTRQRGVVISCYDRDRGELTNVFSIHIHSIHEAEQGACVVSAGMQDIR